MLIDEDFKNLEEVLQQIKSINENFSDCGDIWLSDVKNLQAMFWKLEAIKRNNVRYKDGTEIRKTDAEEKEG